MPRGNGIEVDGKALDGFAGNVDQWASRGLQPDVDTVMADYRLGTKFGAGLSGVSDTLETARKRYQECLEQASVTLAEYVSAATILVNAVKQVRANYGNVDLGAADNEALLLRELTAASAVVATRREQAGAAYSSAQEANNHGANASTLPGDYR